MPDVTADSSDITAHRAIDLDITAHGLNVAIYITFYLDITTDCLNAIAVTVNVQVVASVNLDYLNITFNLDVNVLLVFFKTLQIGDLFAVNKELVVDYCQSSSVVDDFSVNNYFTHTLNKSEGKGIGSILWYSTTSSNVLNISSRLPLSTT